MRALYLRISRDRLRLRDPQTGKELEVTAAFSTQRMLVGNFKTAETHLREALEQLSPPGLLRTTPLALVHPLEMVDGGLCEVEQRVLCELTEGAGARLVRIHLGSELADEAVLAELKKPRN